MQTHRHTYEHTHESAMIAVLLSVVSRAMVSSAVLTGL